MEEIKTLLIQQLEELNDAERQWLEALAGFAEAAHAPELRQAIEAEGKRDHADIERLRAAFNALGAPNRFRVSKGMRGLIEEAMDAIRNTRRLGKSTADTALGIGLRKIKHYEICAYDCACTLAIRLDNTEVAALLAQTKHAESEFGRPVSDPSPKVVEAA